MYLNYLAREKYFDDEDFVRYLDYLQYFREPEYLRYLQYVQRSAGIVIPWCVAYCYRRWPGPTLRALELMQQEAFRKDILRDDVRIAMEQQGFDAAISANTQ